MKIGEILGNADSCDQDHVVVGLGNLKFHKYILSWFSDFYPDSLFL